MEEGARQSILRGVLALLLLLPGIAVAAVERTVLTQEDLSRRVSSNFYVVGFCESLGPECDTLQDLLEASDAALGGSSSSTLRHMLLLQQPAYWAATLGTSHSTHLWFACHDGTTIQMTPLARPHNTTADAQHSTSTSSSSSAQQHQHAKECSKGSSCTATPGDGTKDPQWYLDPTVSKADRLDLLLAAAAQAAEQQGAACIKGQLQHAMANPTAAALAQKRQQLSSLPSPAGRGSHKTPPPAAAQQAAAAAGGGDFSLKQQLQRAFNSAMVLLAVFAAGRFWPQISGLYLRLAGTSPPPSTTTPVEAAAAAVGAAAGAVGGGGDGLPVVPEKLTISPPAAPASLPSAPTTPARIITQHQPDGGLTSPVPLNLALNSGIPSTLEGPGGRALSTAASLDQLQMDNAQLAELVSQLHSEVGGSRAAAADATAAVHRQQAATQEALCCLQEQLVELETRITVVEEFGTAFNAAASAAASVAQQHQQHQQQRQQGQQDDSPLSRYPSCIEVHSGSSISGSAAAGAAGDSASPFAMAAQGSAASTLQSTPPSSSAAAPSAASRLEQQQAQQRLRANKVSASGAAAAAAAAAAASAAATAAAAAARGGAATEAALQQLCDLLARQGVATVGALESLTDMFTHPDTAAAAAAASGGGSAAAGEERNSPRKAEAADAAAALLQAHLGTLRIATTGIAALSDSLRGIRAPMASSTGAAAVGAAATTPGGTASGSSMVTPTTQVSEAAAGATEEGLVTPEKASAPPHSSHAGSPSPLPTPQPKALALGVSGGGDVGVELANSPESPAAALAAAGGSSCKVPVQPVSPVEADAAAATWAELQSRIRGGDRRSSSGSSTAHGGSSMATPAAAAAPLTGTTAAVGAGSAGSDGWEEVVVTDEVKRA